MGLEIRGGCTDQTADSQPFKVVILVKDNGGVALIGRENEDVRVGMEGGESRFFAFGDIGFFRKAGGKF